MNRFPRVLGVRTGYDPDQVDLLIRRIEGTLGRGSLEGEPITADEIRDARFRTKLGGYHELAVDFALEAFIVAVETRPTGVDGRPLVPPSRLPVPPSRPVLPPHRPSVPWPTAPQALEWERAQPAYWDQRSGELDEGVVEPVAWQSQVAEGDQRSGELGGGAVEPETEPVAGQSQVVEGDQWSGEPDAGVVEPEPVAWQPQDAGEPAPPGVIDVEEQAARVEQAAFRAGRLGMGYNEDQVDLFLDRIVATLRGTTDQPLTSGDVRGARFATVMLRPGYAVAEVDGFLTDLADVLEVVGRQRVPQE